MTLLDFYKYACLAAKHRGFDLPKKVNVSAMVHGGEIYYYVSIWMEGNKKVECRLQRNPVSAIRAFKNAINFYKHEYSKQVEDITL